ncbi:MAG TPA: DUF885 domain-containing protein [Polyangiaceae bacterium]|nr:DUF885 domain-containing protein [Polyangiaceae bacterium]
MSKPKTRQVTANWSEPKSAAGRALRSLGERYIETTMERFPSVGSAMGRHEYDGELELPSEKLLAAQQKLLSETLSAVEAIPEHDVDGDDWLDRRALLAELRTELWSYERETHRRNPESWVSSALGSIHHLVVRNADDLTPVAEAIAGRLAKLPDYLEGAAELLKRPVPLWRETAQSSVAGAPALFEAIREPLAATGKIKPKRLESLLGNAAAAFKQYGKRSARLAAGKPRDFSLGRVRFEALMRERLGWDLTANEALAYGRTLVERIEAEMEAEAARLSPRKRPRDILERAAADWAPARGDLLSEYQHETERVAGDFRRADIVSFPVGDELLVKPVPDFFRHQFPTAAYSSPGCYDKKQIGVFWVNDLSLTRATERERRAEVSQHFGVPATCAHEAYPGHHLQFCIANRHSSPLRRWFAHSVFYEGWTLWCEQMAVDNGVNQDPTARLNLLHDALWRAHRILVDCGLHAGELTYDGAVKHLMKHVGFTRGRAEGDVNWYTAAPTVPMSYLIGKMEVMRLKRRKVDEGGWSLKRYNDWLLSFGTVPQRWIEQSGL